MITIGDGDTALAWYFGQIAQQTGSRFKAVGTLLTDDSGLNGLAGERRSLRCK